MKRTVAEVGRAGADQIDVRSTNLLYRNEGARVSNGVEQFHRFIAQMRQLNYYQEVPHS